MKDKYSLKKEIFFLLSISVAIMKKSNEIYFEIIKEPRIFIPCKQNDFIYARYDDRYDREGHFGTSRLVLSCYLARCLRDISPRGSIDRSDGRTVAVLRRWINGITGSVNDYGN